MTGVSEPWRLGHRPALDGLRGIAVLLVIGQHTRHDWFPQGGTAGVILFFTLSGYLITRQLLTKPQTLMHFYERRARRLVPALVPVFVAAPLIYLATNDHERGPGVGGELLAAATYTTDVARVFSGDGWTGILGHTWTLAVEEQFYLVWPLLLGLALRRRVPLSATLFLGFALLTVWRLVAVGEFSYERVYFGPDTNAFALVGGCLLATLERSGQYGWLFGSRPFAWGGLSVIFLVALVPAASEEAVLLLAIPAAVAAVAVIGGAADRGLLMLRPLRYAGRISYGWYLWHGLLVFVTLDGQPLTPGQRMATVPVSFLLAALSWHLVERRWLRRSGDREADSIEGNPTGRPLVDVELDVAGRLDLPLVAPRRPYETGVSADRRPVAARECGDSDGARGREVRCVGVADRAP